MSILCGLGLISLALAQGTTNRVASASGTHTNHVQHASLKAYPNALVSLKDPKSGIIVIVESNGRRLLATTDAGKYLWSVDIIDACGTPETGQPVIRHLAISGDTIAVTFGRHSFAKVKLTAGEITCEGSD